MNSLMKTLASMVLACCAVCQLSASHACAAEEGGRNAMGINRELPTSVESDSMVYEEAALTVVFSGSVHVFREDMELWADRLTVYLHPNDRKAGGSGEKGNSSGKEKVLKGMNAGNVKSTVAEGHVRMKSGDRSGICDRAVYDADTEMLVMTGNPVLSEPSRQLAGAEIRYHAASRRSECRSAPGQRVKAVFSGKATSMPRSSR